MLHHQRNLSILPVSANDSDEESGSEERLYLADSQENIEPLMDHGGTETNVTQEV